MIRKLFSVFALVLAMVFAASPAFAHSDEIQSTPENGSTVTNVDQITFVFVEAVLIEEGRPEYDPEVAVTNSDGIAAELGAPIFDVTGASMTVPILSGPLPDGEYTAAYAITSNDGHNAQGAISFTVEGSSAPALTGSAEDQEAVVTSGEALKPEPRDLDAVQGISQEDANVITLSVILSLAGTVLLVWAVIVVIRRRKK